MKLAKLFILPLITVVFSTACSKKDDTATPSTTPTNNNNNNNSNSGFSAVVDGQAYPGKYVYAERDGRSIYFYGTNGKQQLVILTTFTVGSHDLTFGDGNGCKYVPDSTAAGYYNATTGNITITEIDSTNRTFTGTFSYTLDYGSGVTKQVTTGVLNKVKYFGYGVSVDNAVSCKIDGNPFHPSATMNNAQHLNGTYQFGIPYNHGFYPSISMSIPNTVKTGNTVSIDNNNTKLVYHFGEETKDWYFCESGTITITQNDETNKVITGTFSATIKDIPTGASTKAITDGTFRIAY